MIKRDNLKVVYLPTEDLIPYARNARTHSPEQIAKVAASIKEFGFTNPILTDGEKGVIAGHGRLMAARKLGLEKVPTIALNDLTEAQKRAYILADNRLAEMSGWDDELPEIELGELKELDFDLATIGFEDYGIDEDVGEEDLYTQKVDIPQYEITGEAPSLAECVDTSKSEELTDRIQKAEGISPEERAFLLTAAQRHNAFSYSKVAEYYAHASPEMQRLMEASALVLIDFNDAIKNGFVKLSAAIEGKYLNGGAEK